MVRVVLGLLLELVVLWFLQFVSCFCGIFFGIGIVLLLLKKTCAVSCLGAGARRHNRPVECRRCQSCTLSLPFVGLFR